MSGAMGKAAAHALSLRAPMIRTAATASKRMTIRTRITTGQIRAI